MAFCLRLCLSALILLCAPAGSPQVNRLSSLQNRTFDAAPGSPLRRGASSITVGPISRQGTPHKVGGLERL